MSYGEWQPIATAPKNEKVLVGWLGIINMGRLRSEDGRWIAVNSSFPFNPEHPTHWMPLPPPPTEKDKS